MTNGSTSPKVNLPGVRLPVPAWQQPAPSQTSRTIGPSSQTGRPVSQGSSSLPVNYRHQATDFTGSPGFPMPGERVLEAPPHAPLHHPLNSGPGFESHQNIIGYSQGTSDRPSGK